MARWSLLLAAIAAVCGSAQAGLVPTPPKPGVLTPADLGASYKLFAKRSWDDPAYFAYGDQAILKALSYAGFGVATQFDYVAVPKPFDPQLSVSSGAILFRNQPAVSTLFGVLHKQRFRSFPGFAGIEGKVRVLAPPKLGQKRAFYQFGPVVSPDGKRKGVSYLLVWQHQRAIAYTFMGGRPGPRISRTIAVAFAKKQQLRVKAALS